MLINRRQALITLGLTTCSGVTWSLTRPFQQPLLKDVAAYPAASETKTDKTIDDRLREDLDRLAKRALSEEGVPVFLACMNLVPHKSAHKALQNTEPPFSKSLATALHRNVEAFERIKPDPKPEDMTSILAVLADRDFSTGSLKEAL